MFVFASLLSAIVGVTNLVAQVPATTTPLPAAPPAATDTLNNGACLDSRAVPSVLQPPAVRSMQIVRIDKVVSTASMLPNEVIGFLYTLQDGSSWLGQRTADYVSSADARQINHSVLGFARGMIEGNRHIRARARQLKRGGTPESLCTPSDQGRLSRKRLIFVDRHGRDCIASSFVFQPAAHSSNVLSRMQYLSLGRFS